jgi:hypothetical protein
MGSLIHRTVYFLMITLVINTCGWTFNKEAVSDVWFDEQPSVVVDAGSSPAESGGIHADLPKNGTCNHWCHAVVHLAGLLNPWVPVVSEFANGQISNIAFVIDSSIPDSLFRPPRLLS